MKPVSCDPKGSNVTAGAIGGINLPVFFERGVLRMMEKRIEYTSADGYRGLLYNWHYDDWTGEWNYSMSIRDSTGFEVLHSYNASPKSKDELKRVVDGHGSIRFILEDLAKRTS